MSTKTNVVPTIPRKVADAIERLRAEPHPYNNQSILTLALPENHRFCGGPSVDAVRSIPFDTLLAALVNGWEIEKTAEEIAEEKRQAAYESVRFVYEAKMHEARTACWGVARARESGIYAAGIKFALTEIGVRIKGVNV